MIQKHRLPASPRHLVPGAFAATLSLLLLIFPFFATARIALAGLLALYLSVILLASVITAVRTEVKLLPILPATFACFHLGYGFGFLFGVWDFMVKRQRAGRFVNLTRN